MLHSLSFPLCVDKKITKKASDHFSDKLQIKGNGLLNEYEMHEKEGAGWGCNSIKRAVGGGGIYW